MTAQPVNSYDRQIDESEDAWVAFQRYRDCANPRPTFALFSTGTGYPVSRLKAWANTHDWHTRLVSWDQVVDATRQATTLRGVEEMTSRHIRVAKKGLDAAEKALDKILHDLSDPNAPYARLKPHEIARLVEVHTKLERLSRGEATERVEGEGVSYGALTDDDLAKLEEISRKVH